MRGNMINFINRNLPTKIHWTQRKVYTKLVDIYGYLYHFITAVWKLKNQVTTDVALYSISNPA